MQSRFGSLAESVVNIAVGLGVSILTQIIVFPWFAVSLSVSENLAISGVFTLGSLVRSYALRRMFNWLAVHGVLK